MLEQTHRRRRPTAFFVSLALHAAVVGALLYRPTPPLLQPSSALRGNGGGARTVVTLVAPGVSELAAEKRRPLEDEDKKQTVTLRREKKTKAEQPRPQVATAQQADRPGTPGFVLGSLSSGFASEHDVRIAIPTFSPDPPVVRAKLPEWIRGDVVIEVTISEEGAVTETKILKSLGFGLEEAIADTLRRWKFTPAVVDGVAVASRQDVHYHFPS